MKLFINKIKLLFVMSSLAMVLSSCAGGPRTNVLGEKFQQNKNSNYVQVIKDNKYLYKGIDSSLLNNKSNTSIENKYPIFILSGGLNSISSAYAQNICNKLNSYPLNDKYLCLFYPVTKTDQYSVLMRPTLPINKSDNTVWADFLITNTTDILDKQLYNKGPLASYPTLDVVMFLNGSYLYVLGDIKYKSLGLKSFVDNYKKQNPLKMLNVGYYNDESKNFLQKIIQSNKWDVKLNFIDMKKDTKKNLNLDLLIDFGINVSSNLQNFLNKNRNQYIPLNIDMDTIKNTQILNKDLSYANIVNYYTYDQLANIVKVVNTSDKSIKQNNNSNMVNNVTSNNNNNKLPPFVTSNKYPSDFDSKVFGKSAFNFNLKPVDDILKQDKLASVDNIVINTIGIRSVLVASRATNPAKVSIIISAFLDGFDMYKNNLPTFDMEYYNIPDLLLGDLYQNNLIYHYGVMSYNQFLNDKSITLSAVQNIIVTTINNNLTMNNFPKKFGPSLANDKEMQYINMQVMNNKLLSQQNQIINKFNYFINSIKNELEKDNNSFDMVNVYTNNNSDVNINPMNFSYDMYNNININ